MRSFELNKLVRGGVFRNMQEMGQTVLYRRLAGSEKLRALGRKMVEEAMEFDPESESACDELADQLEAIEQSAAELGIGFDALRARQLHRREERGGLEEGIFVERVGLKDGDPYIEYYAAHPERFKEIAE